MTEEGLYQQPANATNAAATNAAAPANTTINKDRFVFEHVWKTGGTELCRLARANGWKVPEKPGCTLFIHPHQGWPTEDYDMIGNEGAIPSGQVTSLYAPQNEFVNNTRQFLTIPNVQWITTVRHPYSRTLSHYHHAIRSQEWHNLTLFDFVTQPHGGGFHRFITNQQTRWHCGTGSCVSSNTRLTPQDLQHAMDNLRRMRAVLILEDMSPSGDNGDNNDTGQESCTRRQMRHVLKFETLDLVDNDSDSSRIRNNNTQPPKPPPRNSKTNWEEVIRPYLDDFGASTNQWSLRPSLQQFQQQRANSNNHSSATTNSSTTMSASSSIMAALSLHNDYDLQLYGYARHLCQILADKYDLEEADAKTALLLEKRQDQEWTMMASSTTSNVTETVSSDDHDGTTTTSLAATSSPHPNSNNMASWSSYQQPVSSSLLMMYVVGMVGLVVLSRHRRRRNGSLS